MPYLSKRTALEAALAAITSFVLSLIVFTPILGRLAGGWSGGDLLSTYINAEMWSGFSYRVTDQMGFPLGMDLNYFPGIDITENLFAQLVTAITGQPFVGINLLIVISFPIVAALAYLAIRMTNLDGPIAIALAVAFSVIPYHWGRALGHTYLSTLYSAVTGMLIVLLIGSGLFPGIFRSVTAKRRIVMGLLVLGLVIVTAWTGVYYAAFTLLLGLAAVGWRFARGDKAKDLLIATTPLVGILVFAVIGFLPGLLARSGDAPLAVLSERMPYESVLFAGILAATILPAPISMLPGFGFYNRNIVEAVNAAPLYENNRPTNFGTWVTTAALVLFVVAIIWRARTNTERHQQGITPGFIATQIAVVVLLFVPWGVNYLIAGLVTAQIRGWNRLLPFLLLLFLLGAAVILRDSRITRRNGVSALIAVAVLIVTAVESVLPFRASFANSVDEHAKITQAARDYATIVNEKLPDDCGILQLPYFAYPEHGLVEGAMTDYDHFWVSLLNLDKRWSYGAVKNTTASIWAAQLPQTPTDEQLQHLQAAGFCAIHVDLDGYDEAEGELVLWDLTKRIGKPSVTNETGNWALFRLPNPAPIADPSLATPEVVTFLHPPFIQAPIESAGMRESMLNDTWWWLTHPETTFTFTPTDDRVPLAGVTGAVEAPSCEKADITATLTAGEDVQTFTTKAKPGTAVPFDLRLTTPVAGQATLAVSSTSEGCFDPGIPQRRYAIVRDLTSITP